MTFAIGRSAMLEVLRVVPMGLILGDSQSEVLLPGKEVPDGASPGDRIEVFVYTDSEDRPVATTAKPLAETDQFACLEVVSVSRTGAFLDWGLPKDLLLPHRSQIDRVHERQSVVVRVLLDRVSQRPVASAKVERFLSPAPEDLREGQSVEILIYQKTDLGNKAIVDGLFGGLLYATPGEPEPEVGTATTAYIQRIREDGKIDLSLTATGRAGIDQARDVVLQALARARGRLELGDQSPPGDIKRALGLSKKAFKRAIGGLYRERRIRIGDLWIESTDSDGSRDSKARTNG